MNHGPDSTPGTDRDTEPVADRDAAPGTQPGAVVGPTPLRGVDAPADTLAAGLLTDLFGSGSCSGSGSGSGSGDGGDVDEDALRRMMRGAVQDLEPRDGSLDHLYRAVPARRARRRQALVGAAAAALLIGTAIPAFVHVAHSEGSNAASPAIAGHGERAQGGNGEEPGPASGGANGGGGSDGREDAGDGVPDSSASPSASSGQGVQGTVAGGSADPQASAAAGMPTCSPDQLGVASASTGAAGADGTVYGTFRIANVSGKNCSVNSGGTVGFEAMGAADPARIVVVRHTQGDAASGLPDPAEEESTVLLKPEMAYEVQFAWVPGDTCPSTGGSPSPTPTDGAAGNAGGSDGASTGSGTGGTETGTEAQLGSEDGAGTAQGSVSVQHTPEPGAPVAETKIANACAGTIYRTGALEPSS
ncbi:hypothetical protein [Streptomyces sp. NBC_01285]|uniref:hypothetical protein n=1 Tax=Streptomyces sp. NBC_01285 TaxID=2903813 RepID=UPI00224CDC88|nr:hypothetical protein [Streptomyces sp. NBC_01285]MCX4771586.1 hypothetical protein [Streptomyces sp. NBC_01285]